VQFEIEHIMTPELHYKIEKIPKNHHLLKLATVRFHECLTTPTLSAESIAACVAKVTLLQRVHRILVLNSLFHSGEWSATQVTQLGMKRMHELRVLHQLYESTKLIGTLRTAEFRLYTSNRRLTKGQNRAGIVSLLTINGGIQVFSNLGECVSCK
jgi:hypothetical protein